MPQHNQGRIRKPYKGKACFDLLNTPFGRVAFLEKDRRANFHLLRHPELNDSYFIGKMVEAIKNPEKVYRSLKWPYRDLVIYKKLGSVINPLNPKYNFSYTRVVLGTENKWKRVLTGFGFNHIKEGVEVKLVNGQYK